MESRESRVREDLQGPSVTRMIAVSKPKRSFSMSTSVCHRKSLTEESETLYINLKDIIRTPKDRVKIEKKRKFVIS